MSFKHSCDVTVQNLTSIHPDVFTVGVQTHFFLFKKPHAVVIPKLLAGRFTAERGFMIEFTTDDPEILMQWHQELCEEVASGNYGEMVGRARMGLFPIDDDDPEMIAMIKGFRAS